MFKDHSDEKITDNLESIKNCDTETSDFTTCNNGHVNLPIESDKCQVKVLMSKNIYYYFLKVYRNA